MFAKCLFSKSFTCVAFDFAVIKQESTKRFLLVVLEKGGKNMPMIRTFF